MSSSSPSDKLDDAAKKQLARHASQRNLETKGTMADLKPSSTTEKKKPALAAWKHSLAGAVAGYVVVGVVGFTHR
jgi:hypothetical protein